MLNALLAALTVLGLVFAWIAVRVLLPLAIQNKVREAPLDKLVSIYDASITEFTSTGICLRLLMNVWDTRLPFVWMTAGLLHPPTLLIHIAKPLHPPLLATVSLSDPVTLSGEHDLWVNQRNVRIDIKDVDSVKSLLRKVVAQGGSTDGLTILIRLVATIHFCGYILCRDLALEKIVDVAEVDKRKIETLERLLKEGTVFPEEVESPFDEDDDVDGTVEQDVDQKQKRDQNGLRPKKRRRMRRRPPGPDGIFPGPVAFDRSPVETATGLTCLTTTLRVTFAHPPALRLRLASVSFDVLLNGHLVATTTLTGLELVETSTMATLCLEVRPLVTNRPVRGLLSGARGVLRGAVNATFSGLVNGEWGSGASVLSCNRFVIEDSAGSRVEWLEDLVQTLAADRSYDLDAVRRLGGAAQGLVGVVAETVKGVVQAGGSRCSIL